jgi:hypothetical protein
MGIYSLLLIFQDRRGLERYQENMQKRFALHIYFLSKSDSVLSVAFINMQFYPFFSVMYDSLADTNI